jgi:hypothetical protein
MKKKKKARLRALRIKRVSMVSRPASVDSEDGEHGAYITLMKAAPPRGEQVLVKMSGPVVHVSGGVHVEKQEGNQMANAVRENIHKTLGALPEDFNGYDDQTLLDLKTLVARKTGELCRVAFGEFGDTPTNRARLMLDHRDDPSVRELWRTNYLLGRACSQRKGSPIEDHADANE